MNSTKPTLFPTSPDSLLPPFSYNIHIVDILIALHVFIIIRTINKKNKRHNGNIPSWPVLGMLPSLAIAVRTNLYEWLTAALRNGTFIFKGPLFTTLNCVVTSDPRNVEYLLKSNFPNFPKGPYFRDTVHDLLGDGIFGADGDTWRRQRQVASVEFHGVTFRHMITETLHELVHTRLLPVLECSGTSPFDLQDVLLRLTFDNVCMIAFGVDPGCLRPARPDIPFARAFEDATEATLFRFVMPAFLWKTMRWVGVGSEKRLKESIKKVDGFAHEIIRKKRLSTKEGDNSDLLTMFMRIKDERGRPFSDKFLRDICVNFILAGRDTSSVALTWFFWLLHRNPTVEERIVDEIQRIKNDRGKCSDPEKEEGVFVFNREEIKKMDYLQAAITEALRLYPSVPVDHKEVAKDDVFPDGTVLKKGTKVIYVIYAMGRMENIWGKDYEKFRPERWLKEGRFVGESAYKFTAFNGGPRLCLGKEFAYYQMKFVVASVLNQFHVKVVENHPVKPKLALTMYIKDGLKVVLCKRDGPRFQN